MLAAILNRQEQLKSLSLVFNYFSSEATKLILTQLLASQSRQCLEQIQMHFSANFGASEACEALAELVATAPALKMINISY